MWKDCQEQMQSPASCGILPHTSTTRQIHLHILWYQKAYLQSSGKTSLQRSPWFCAFKEFIHITIVVFILFISYNSNKNNFQYQSIQNLPLFWNKWLWKFHQVYYLWTFHQVLLIKRINIWFYLLLQCLHNSSAIFSEVFEY